MACGLLEKARPIQDGAAFRILGRKHQPLDARQTDRAGAHRTRLERNEKRRTDEPLVGELGRTGAQHKCLGMRGRIAPLDDAVTVRRQKRSVRRQKHRADRHLAPLCRGLGFGERQCYGFRVNHPGPEEFGQD